MPVLVAISLPEAFEDDAFERVLVGLLPEAMCLVRMWSPLTEQIWRTPGERVADVDGEVDMVNRLTRNLIEDSHARLPHAYFLGVTVEGLEDARLQHHGVAVVRFGEDEVDSLVDIEVTVDGLDARPECVAALILEREPG